MAPALATGNTVVLKPASAAPGVGCEIVRALDKAGIPDGVVNLVTGPGSEVGDVFTCGHHRLHRAHRRERLRGRTD